MTVELGKADLSPLEGQGGEQAFGGRVGFEGEYRDDVATRTAKGQATRGVAIGDPLIYQEP